MKTVINIVLHGSLPYVHPHRNEEGAIYERSFYQSMAETYLPLLSWLDSLDKSKFDSPITLALAPALWSMMDSVALREGVADYLATALDVADYETTRLSDSPLGAAAGFHLERRKQALAAFEKVDRDVVGALIEHAADGKLELIAVVGSAILPLVSTPEFRRAHIRGAIAGFRARFSLPLTGVWLPECGYSADLDELLAEEGIRYSFVANEAVEGTQLGRFAPVLTARGLALFPAQTHASALWEGGWRRGYVDTGTPANWSGVAPLHDADDLRSSTDLHLFRVSDATNGHSEPYRPDAGAAKVRDHALNFMHGLNIAVEASVSRQPVFGDSRPPVATYAFDAELFGRWWPEGTGFLAYLQRMIHQQEDLVGATGDAILDRWPRLEVTHPKASTSHPSSGFGTWLDPSNRWLHRHLHGLEERFLRIWPGTERGHQGSWRRRAANVALKEIMMAQTSDFCAAIALRTASGYAIERTEGHVSNASEMLRQLSNDEIDRKLIERLEQETAFLKGVDVDTLITP